MDEKEKRGQALETAAAAQAERPAAGRDAAALAREKLRMRRRAVRLSSLPQSGVRRKAASEQPGPDREEEPEQAVAMREEPAELEENETETGEEPFFGREEEPSAEPEPTPVIAHMDAEPAPDPGEEPFWIPEEEQETAAGMPAEEPFFGQEAMQEQAVKEEAAVKEGDTFQEEAAFQEAEMPQYPAEAETFPLSRKENRRKEKQEEKERRQLEAEDRERIKREAEEAEREARARRKREEEEERERQLSEKKQARLTARLERVQEWKSLWRTAEFAMLLSFIVLAMDQVGIYGFLFVWLAIALAVASIALLFLGIARGIRRKRCGIVFFAAIAGIILCTAWFIFLISERGLGVAPF